MNLYEDIIIIVKSTQGLRVVAPLRDLVIISLDLPVLQLRELIMSPCRSKINMHLIDCIRSLYYLFLFKSFIWLV
jgi:hypothetical protein